MDAPRRAPAAGGERSGEATVLTRLLAPILRRDRRLRHLATLLTGIAAGSLAAALAPSLGFGEAGTQGAFAVLWSLSAAATAGVMLHRAAPSARTLARRIDRDLKTGECLATALEQESAGARSTLATALRAEAAALARALPPRPRTGAERAAIRSAGALAAALAVAIALPVATPRGQGPVAPPNAADLAALARAVAEDAAASESPALAAAAEALRRRAADIAREGPPAEGDAAVSAALDMAAAAYAGRETASGDRAPAAPAAVAEWTARGAAGFGEGEAGPPRSHARPLVAPAALRAAGEREDDAMPRADSVTPSAAIEAADLRIAEDPALRQSPGRAGDGDGTSDFIPPSLVEGDPRAGQAIDLAGVGAAERQESMTARHGGTGAFAAGDAPPPPAESDATLDLRSTPFEGRRIRYYTEYVEPEDRPRPPPSSVTAGPLPDWPRLRPAPVERQPLGAADRGTVARYFDRTEHRAP